MSEDLRVSRWKRYGKDRSYVGPADGDSIGYLDNQTGVVHVTDEADRQRVMEALGLAPATPAEAATAKHDDYAIRIDRIARDLGTNVAGGSAREKAKELNAQAPLRNFFARALGVHTDERAWRVGGEGERLIARELEKLSPLGWTFVHDVPVGKNGANIDHVAVGPGGVFTINSKYHVTQSVWCSGEWVKVGKTSTRYVPIARYEAQRASKYLSAAYGAPVAVTGLVVIMANDWTQKSQPRDGAVLVMGPASARRHLAALPPVYAVHEVDRLALLARRDTTWQP